MKNARDLVISLFVIFFILLFHYESLAYFYLDPWVGHRLPKMKFLFPPAGWIMFYNVDDTFGSVEVYGVKNGVPQRLDPHDILQTRHIGYDNIHRDVLSEVVSTDLRLPFCAFLERKFPDFEDFRVNEVFYLSLTHVPRQRMEDTVYACRDLKLRSRGVPGQGP